MTPLTLIFLGGGIGATLRYLLSKISLIYVSKIWFGTLLVNILGCLIFFLLGRLGIAEEKSSHAFFKIGLLGSLTTFSTFSYEVVTLFKQHQFLEGGLVIFLNIFFGIIIGIWVLR